MNPLLLATFSALSAVFSTRHDTIPAPRPIGGTRITHRPIRRDPSAPRGLQRRFRRQQRHMAKIYHLTGSPRSRQ